MKHTPTPWTLYEDQARIAAPSDIFTRRSTMGEYKSASLTDDRGEFHNPADAAHIVRCVNSHGELLEALDLARAAIVHYAGDSESCLGTLATIDSAIAKARGE